MQQPDFTIASFAAAIAASRNTVYRLINTGAIRAYKAGNCTRIPFGEQERLRTENQIEPHTQARSLPVP
jgi:excisionase family DNA binding protein|tara:strand:+ start:2286 stop:2492 length:207 start_codon:yes stop_codon:yes gene_type:complete